VDDSLYPAIARPFLFRPAMSAAALVLGFVQPLLGLACYLGVVVLHVVPGAGELPSGTTGLALPDHLGCAVLRMARLHAH
jgi:hypothetical protein